MKYEKPEVRALTDAIRVIQNAGSKPTADNEDSSFNQLQPISCYEDTE